MKKTIITMSALLLLSATLAACNTDTSTPETTTAASKEVQTEPKEQTQTNSQTNTEQTTTQQVEAKEEDKNVQTTPQQTEEASTLTYISNGKTFTEAVTTSKSEEMNYTISHFDSYTLQAEDPGIDHLLNSEDDNLSMQIEVTPKEEVTFENVKASAAETMAAISSEVSELDFSAILEHRTDVLNIVGYETVFEDVDKVVKVVFERDNMLVTLTIYDTVTADLQDAFLQMGLSIQ